MNWKWGGKMNRGKCIYYVEGPCEQQLISALKEAPEKLIPGKNQSIQCGSEPDSEVSDAVDSGRNNGGTGI